MKSIALIVTALFIVGTGAAGDADSAVLRPMVTVNTDVVRLGDLFADVGDKRNVAVAAAPAPGAKITLNAGQLQSIARRSGLAWRPHSRYESAVVKRAGKLVSAGDIEKLIHRALRKAGLPADRKIRLSKADLAVHMAAGENRAIRVTDPRYNVPGRQFSAVLEVPNGPDKTRRMQVTGRLYEVIKLPVLGRRVPRGETIRMGDLDFVDMRRDAVGPNAIIDARRIVGRTPRRLLHTGKPLQSTDLRLPFLVSKGKLVTLSVRNRHMLITAQGRALESGAKGDVIRVANTRSRNTIQGIVDGPNRVTVIFPGTQP